MRYTISAFVAFVASAAAQTAGFDALSTPAQDENVAAGATYTVVWDASSYTTETVSLSLLGGASSTTLQDLGVFASGVDNGAGSYAWAVDASLGADVTYGIKITLDSDSSIFQYSFPFHIVAGSSSETVVATTAVSTSSAATAAAETYAAEAATTYSETSAAETYAATTISSSSSAAAAYPTTSFAATTATAPSAVGNYSTTLASHTKTASSTAGGNSTATSTPVVAGAARSFAGSVALVGSLAMAAVFAL